MLQFTEKNYIYYTVVSKIALRLEIKLKRNSFTDKRIPSHPEYLVTISEQWLQNPFQKYSLELGGIFLIKVPFYKNNKEKEECTTLKLNISYPTYSRYGFIK